VKGYEALRSSAAWIDLPGRGKIRASGEDRARLLHAMTTNHVQQLKPGDGCYAFFLNSQGRILADVQILCREDDFLLDTEPETAQKVYQHLDKFIIADDVTLEDLTGQTATIAVEGPKAMEALANAGAQVPEREYSIATWGERTVVRTSYTGAPGFFVVTTLDDREALIQEVERAGIEAAGADAAEVVRLERGKPRYGPDISERYLAEEANQTRALHFDKGCYLGQEIVERVRSRGQIHRRLLPVHLETGDVPPAGTKLQSGDKDAAEITSAAYSPALGKTVALAYVRNDYKPGDRLRLGEVGAVVMGEPALFG
jgi:aminomethyltransferase